MRAEPTYFTDLFNSPSIEGMHKLSPTEFEKFVAYVMRRAGYDARDVGLKFLRGIDVEIRYRGSHVVVGGIECKRFGEGQLVGAPIVKGAKGAPANEGKAATPYVITTSDFNGPARKLAVEGKKPVQLINGNQFVRFINYVRASRYDDDDSTNVISPEFFAGDESVRSRKVGSTKVLAIANNKGGVGKTTTAFYLGSELAMQGKRVLLIDLDGQANLTERCLPHKYQFEIDSREQSPNVVQYFSGDRRLGELITPTQTEGLFLLPSDPFLRLREPGGTGNPKLELDFVREVQQLCDNPPPLVGGMLDWIVIDTPPAMSQHTRAALACAQYILAPVRPRPTSVQGTINMLQTMKTMEALMGSNADFLGTLITHEDGLQITNEFIVVGRLPLVLNELSTGAIKTSIPDDNQLDRLTPGARTGGAKAYAQLAKEVLAYGDSNDS